MPITLVIFSGILHSIWNLFLKQSRNKIVYLWIVQWVGIVLFLPWAIKDVMPVHIPAIGYGLLLGSMLLHGVYVNLLARTYFIGDLSQVYPIMRGTGPLLVPIIGVTLLGESLTAFGWIGVACVIVGIFMLSGIWRNDKDTTGASRRSTLLALGVGISIVCYTLFDKLALQYIPAITLNETSNIANMLALTWATLRSGEIRQEWTANWKTILLGGVIAPGGYILFLLAMSMMPVAQLGPMREIGTVFGTILGVFVLKESQGASRLGASIFITLGVILLGIWG